MRQHLTIVAVLHLLLGAFNLFGALTVLTASVAAGALLGVSGDAPGTGLLVGTLGSALGVFLLLLALPGLLLAWGIHRRRGWARPLGFVVGALNLLHFPIGTLIGAYTLWVLLQPETETLLARRDPVA